MKNSIQILLNKKDSRSSKEIEKVALKTDVMEPWSGNAPENK